MKLRDNLAALTVVIAALGLEAGLLAVYWVIRDIGGLSVFGSIPFLLQGQVFVLGACTLVYWVSRLVMRPFESILGGIALYGEGKFAHRIPRSKISELDVLVRRLNGMAAKLEELDTLKTDFVANVSHELRSPLAAMQQYVELLLTRGQLSGDNRDNLLRVQSNLERLGTLVENLLEISKIEAGRLPVKDEPFAVAEAVKDVCALLAPRLSARGLSLKTALETAPADFRGDPDKVKQILTNLIDNAVKYNRDNGAIAVSASTDAGALKITVTDTGPGIAPEHIGDLFTRFHRLPPTAAAGKKVKGAGLGLAISRGLARAMGGELSAESRPGEGAAFTLSLPLGRNNP